MVTVEDRVKLGQGVIFVLVEMFLLSLQFAVAEG